MLVKDLAATYRLRNLRSASQESIRLWDIALRLLDRYLGRPATSDDLDEDTFAGFILWRRQTVSAATVNRDLTSLLALWRWAHRVGKVDRWPQVELEKVPERIPVAWTQAEFNQLIRTAKRLDEFIGCIPARLWWHGLLMLLFDSGERITAALDLKWTQVDLPGGWVRFVAETRKGKRRDSIVRICSDTVQAIGSLEPRHSEMVFPWPFCRGYIWDRYGKVLQKAGLPDDRSRKFHCVRKTTASYVEAAGGNATQALRHSSRQTTLAYLDPRIVQPAQATDFLWRPE